MGTFGKYSDKKDKGGKGRWGWGWGSGWGGSRSDWEDDDYGSSYGTSYSGGYGGYSYGGLKSIYDREKVFSDKSEEIQKKMGGLNKKSIEEYLIPNKYGIKDFPKEFHGCLYWIKDLNDTDKKLMEAFARQGKTVIRFISDKDPSLALKEEGSHVSYDGKKMYVSITSMYDWRLEKSDRIDIFFSDMLHETFHLKYTLDDYTEILKAKGHVKQELNKWGRVVQVPNFEQNIFQDPVHARLFNIVEDRRIEALGIEDCPGYAGYFDKSYAYYAWLVAPEISKEIKFSNAETISDFLLKYIHICVLLPNVKPEFMAANKNYTKFTSKVSTEGNLEDIVRKIDALLVHVPTTFMEAFQLSYELRKLIPLPPGHKGMDGAGKTIGLPGKIAPGGIMGTDKLDLEGFLKEGEESKDGGGASGDVGSDSLTGGDDPKKYGKGKHPTVSLPRHKQALLKGRVIDAAEVYYESPDHKNFSSSVYNKALKLSKCFRKDLDFLNSKFTAVDEAFELNSGDLDEDEIATLRFNKNIFTEEDPAKEYSLDLALLIDESGSMGGNKVDNAKVAALALFLAFSDKPNVELFVYGHTAQEHTGTSLEMYRYFDKTKRATDINGIFSVQGRCQNLDGHAILEMGKVLDRGKGASKILIILSDGSPCAGGYHGDAAFDHTRLCAEELERRGIFVIQIAIDAYEGANKMFKHYITFRDNSSLGTDLMSVLHKEFNKIGNNR